MKQHSFYYKTSFDLIFLASDKWLKPFNLRLFTTCPRLGMVASYDGETYKKCAIDEEGRLHLHLSNFTKKFSQGVGQLQVEIELLEKDNCFPDNCLNNFRPPIKLIGICEGDTEEGEVIISLDGEAEGTIVCEV